VKVKKAHPSRTKQQVIKTNWLQPPEAVVHAQQNPHPIPGSRKPKRLHYSDQSSAVATMSTPDDGKISQKTHLDTRPPVQLLGILKPNVP
jgi:hypothetical protein